MQDFLRKSTICLCIVFMFGAAFVMVEFFSVTSFTSGRFLTALTRSELDTGREHISEIKNTVKENKTTTKITTRKTPTHYASVNFEGRLGNQIFEFASLFGIARQNNLIPIIPANSLLRRIFKVSVGNTNPQIKLTKKYYEKKGCVFEPPLMSVGESENLWVKGYLQSWKYFQHAEKELRAMYTFQDSIAQKAKSTFQATIASKKNKITAKTVFVAIHVRRGDMKNNLNYVKYGYTTADMSYISKAMNTFRKDFPDILFVVGSDDLKWCKENIKDDDVVFIPPGSAPEMDIAILTNCNHTIVTVGSYGWWTAWLVNGKTIYYKGFPTPKSQLAALFNAEDYYLPEWIPM
nr:galactoside 2-alpha-L-fucosyltransferase 2-like isoform X2 [Crassostrea virginica]XP_022338997.1 galactoside 2-alpha-L-fucosyltransferase 2-like isoform X2 [Crassostrea virginica]